MEDQAPRHTKATERRLRSWLAQKYAPACAVFASTELTEFLREHASLSPAEFLRPFTEVGNLDEKQVQTCEKSLPFKFHNLRMNMVDIHKVDGRYYKDSEYGGLFQYILDIEKPKDTEFTTILTQMKEGKPPLSEAQRELDLYVQQRVAGSGQSMLTPWYHRWRKWFLDKTRFKDHELLDQPVAFFYFVLADEPALLRSIEQMRKDLPSQYKSHVYQEGRPHNTQEFVLVLNRHAGSSTTFQEAVRTLGQRFPQNMVFEIPMSDRGKAGPGSQVEDLWVDKYIDLDARNLIDVQVAMAEPSARKIRGRAFSQQDRQRIRAHLRKILEVHTVPFIRQRIRTLEEAVAKTKKGLKNSISNFFKKPDRGENDGLKDGFRMSKAELEMRNLCDLAFVSQDYETALQNASYPYKDFKACKAFRFAASCLEVQLLAQLAFDLVFTNQINSQQLDQQAREAYSLYHKSNKSDLLIKYAVMISELYEVLDRLDQSASYLVRIANEIQGAPIIVALFFEQAGLQYLKLKQYRKFAFFTVQAAMNYSSVGQTEYALNCFRLIHPFYQAHSGWHHVRFLVYSNLGAKLQEFKDQKVADDFFKNYLKLCSEVEDKDQQRRYLAACLESTQAWLRRQSEASVGPASAQAADLLSLETVSSVQRMLDVGELVIPLLLDDQIEVFVDSEKLHSNLSDRLIAHLFPHLPQQDDNQDNQVVQITMKSDLNCNTCQWKHMAKSVCDHIRGEKAQGHSTLSDKLHELSVDEITEFAVYDCTSKLSRKELLAKKSRKVYCNTPITLRIVLRNTLSVGLDIKNIKVVCSFQSVDGAKSTDEDGMYTQKAQNLALDPAQTREVVLQVVPLRTGDFEIKRVEWELFEVVRCSRLLGSFSEESMGARRPGDSDMALKFKVIEASGECEAKVILEGQDLQRDQRLLYTECKKGVLRIRNCSSEFKIKNAFVTCSHPLVFNFENEHLFDELPPRGEFDLPIQMRAALVGSNSIKFLIRYEVTADREDAVSGPSRYRFQRLCVQVDAEQSFQPRYRINMSIQSPGTHLVNLSISDHKSSSQIGKTELPQVEAIEIVNKEKRWKICRRDSSGMYFAIEQAGPGSPEESILKLVDSALSVRDDPKLSAFLEKETEFALTKGLKRATDDKREVDFVLHWVLPRSRRRGFMSTCSQDLFSSLADRRRKPLHVAFSYPKQVKVDNEEALPVSVPLHLSLTPMAPGMEEIRVTVGGEVDDGQGLTWMGKVVHKLREPDEAPKRLDLTALVHEFGVYDLNQLSIEVIAGSGQEPIQINLKDEMIVQVLEAENDGLIETAASDQMNLIEV